VDRERVIDDSPKSTCLSVHVLCGLSCSLLSCRVSVDHYASLDYGLQYCGGQEQVLFPVLETSLRYV
jgi:hypothetical protein